MYGFMSIKKYTILYYSKFKIPTRFGYSGQP